jgi:hypothetical protein
MSNHFFVLIDRRDSEKFRKFKNGIFNESTRNVLQKNNANFVWGFHKGVIADNFWKKIHKNDLVYITIPKEKFKISGIISKKTKNANFGSILYAGDLNSKQIQYFLFFKELSSTNESFHEIIDSSDVKIILPRTGMFKITKKRTPTNNGRDFISLSIPKKLPLTRKNGPAQKNKLEVNRFVRDSSMVKYLKDLYQNKCQVCHHTFEYQKSKFYSEVHHYRPLEENGFDDVDNMIVVCANHHAEFDYKHIAISEDGKSIIDRKGEKVGKISFQKGHNLSKKNIHSQLEFC